MGRKVSVIVPVYRTGQWLDRCVSGILAQTYSEIEVILVDDGSPDECPALCDAWAGKDGRVKVIHKENGGLMSAWMAGVSASTGEYLCFVDSDDWIDKEMVEGLMAAASGCQAEVLCGNYVQEEKNRSFPVIQSLKPGVYEGDALRDKVFGRLVGEEKRPITLSRCMKLFSRKLIEDNMHFCDPSIVMGEDMNITLPALLDAKRIVILEGACWYHYLFLKESMVHRYNPRLQENLLLLNQKMREVLKAKHAPDKEGQADREFVLLLFLELKNQVRGGKKGWRKRIRRLRQNPEVAGALNRARLTLRLRENRILYRTLKKPDFWHLTGLKLLFWIYDLRKR